MEQPGYRACDYLMITITFNNNSTVVLAKSEETQGIAGRGRGGSAPQNRRNLDSLEGNIIS